jgi:hypothetical protein
MKKGRKPLLFRWEGEEARGKEAERQEARRQKGKDFIH